jgi:hypothetical protein
MFAVAVLVLAFGIRSLFHRKLRAFQQANRGILPIG